MLNYFMLYASALVLVVYMLITLGQAQGKSESVRINQSQRH